MDFASTNAPATRSERSWRETICSVLMAGESRNTLTGLRYLRWLSVGRRIRILRISVRMLGFGEAAP